MRPETLARNAYEAWKKAHPTWDCVAFDELSPADKHQIIFWASEVKKQLIQNFKDFFLDPETLPDTCDKCGFVRKIRFL